MIRYRLHFCRLERPIPSSEAPIPWTKSPTHFIIMWSCGLWHSSYSGKVRLHLGCEDKYMISRRSFLRYVAGGAVSMVLAPTVFSETKSLNKPNIILCMADDMGWGDPDFNGNSIIKTPNLDAMAKAGMRFTRFYSGAPVCSPTRGSCLTGRHPYR